MAKVAAMPKSAGLMTLAMIRFRRNEHAWLATWPRASCDPPLKTELNKDIFKFFPSEFGEMAIFLAAGCYKPQDEIANDKREGLQEGSFHNSCDWSCCSTEARCNQWVERRQARSTSYLWGLPKATLATKLSCDLRRRLHPNLSHSEANGRAYWTVAVKLVGGFTVTAEPVLIA